jgi:hypothetical protein
MKVPKSLFGLALVLTAATASADPPPSNIVDQHFDLCNGRLRAKINMSFGQTTTTATVRTRSSAVTINPFVAGSSSPTPMEYSVFVAASVKKNASSPWSIASTQQDGIVGVAQPDISIGHSTFKDPTCQIKGTVILSSACPTQSRMTHDSRTIELNWVGCGL